MLSGLALILVGVPEQDRIDRRLTGPPNGPVANRAPAKNPARSLGPSGFYGPGKISPARKT
jgi:hypothetical protein